MMIEIPVWKRHNETQKFYENMYFGNSVDRALIDVLAIIADRLTDIADELRGNKNE